MGRDAYSHTHVLPDQIFSNMVDLKKLARQNMSICMNMLGMDDTSFFKPIRYQRHLVVLISNFDTDASKFKPSSTFLL